MALQFYCLSNIFSILRRCHFRGNANATNTRYLKIIFIPLKINIFPFTHVTNEKYLSRVKVLNAVDFLTIYYIYMYVLNIDPELLVLSNLRTRLIQ